MVRVREHICRTVCIILIINRLFLEKKLSKKSFAHYTLTGLMRSMTYSVYRFIFIIVFKYISSNASTISVSTLSICYFLAFITSSTIERIPGLIRTLLTHFRRIDKPNKDIFMTFFLYRYPFGHTRCKDTAFSISSGDRLILLNDKCCNKS